VSRRFFQNLPQDLQKLLKRTGRLTGEKLIAASRNDNVESLNVLRERGIQFVLNEEELDKEQVTEISRKAGESLMSNGYIPKTVVEQVNQWLLEFRSEMEAEVLDASG